MIFYYEHFIFVNPECLLLSFADRAKEKNQILQTVGQLHICIFEAQKPCKMLRKLEYLCQLFRIVNTEMSLKCAPPEDHHIHFERTNWNCQSSQNKYYVDRWQRLQFRETGLHGFSADRRIRGILPRTSQTFLIPAVGFVIIMQFPPVRYHCQLNRDSDVEHLGPMGRTGLHMGLYLRPYGPNHAPKPNLVVKQGTSASWPCMCCTTPQPTG